MLKEQGETIVLSVFNEDGFPDEVVGIVKRERTTFNALHRGGAETLTWSKDCSGSSHVCLLNPTHLNPTKVVILQR